MWLKAVAFLAFLTLLGASVASKCYDQNIELYADRNVYVYNIDATEPTSECKPRHDTMDCDMRMWDLYTKLFQRQSRYRLGLK
jgi:hypothetical protein